MCNFKRNINKKFLSILVSIIVFVVVCVFPNCIYAEQNDNFVFFGSGKKEDPYLINDVNDLRTFRDLVNSGKDFTDVWFKQTADIDLNNGEWEPIGIPESGNYFYGFYNGDGKIIKNFVISKQYSYNFENGFFGALAGTVFNLGFENGIIRGDYVGSIAAKSVAGTKPIIVNCYSNITLEGKEVGSIANYFENGVIANCYFGGRVNAEENVLDKPVLSNGGLVVGTDIGSNGPSFIEDNITEFSSINQSLKWVMYGCYSGITPEMFVILDNQSSSPYFRTGTYTISLTELHGHGTKESPYLIENHKDLTLLKFLVNTGNHFDGVFFKQTSDITIEEDDWMPIGLEGSVNYFSGIYDGSGHSISGLTIKDHETDSWGNVGVFGQLGGVVANVKLVNTSISGKYCGTMAYSSVKDLFRPAIINCYVQGEVYGERASGLVDTFRQGLIAGCICDVLLNPIYENQKVYEGVTCGIMFEPLDTKVYSSLSTFEYLSTNDKLLSKSYYVPIDDLNNAKAIFIHNVKLGLIQQLFANYYDLEIIQIKSFNNQIPSFEGNSIIRIIGYINEYTLGILLIAALLFYLYLLKNSEPDKLKRYTISYSVIFGIVAVFIDCAFIGGGFESLTLGRMLFLILTNIILTVSLISLKINHFINVKFNYSLLFGALILFIVCVTQWKDVPRYDAHLYYGSLTEGCKYYNFDLLTFFGAFANWSTIHRSSALLIASIEFLLPGRMIGSYISTFIIIVISYYLFYRLLKENIQSISDNVAIILSLTLMFFPYQIGIASYLSYDNLCVYFAIWMIYFYYHNNDFLISFCGYLLLFTKITGGVFYCVFLIVASFVEVLNSNGKNIIAKIIDWIDYKRCMIWVLPGLLYLFFSRFGSWFIIQTFDGSYSSSKIITMKNAVSYGNTLLQSFVFGFRWALVIFFVIYGVYFAKNKQDNQHPAVKQNIIPIIIGNLACVVLLLMYNGNAECPRYTSVLNIGYGFVLAHIIGNIKTETNRFKLSIVIMIVFLTQTFVTIDPSIIINNNTINTGSKQLYSLNLDNDDRESMNLYKNTGYETISDLFVYNREYNYCNELINQAIKNINPDQNTKIYTLDIDEYEFHLRGIQYRIFWDSRKKEFTYAKNNDSFVLNGGNIKTQEIINSDNLKHLLGDDFYIIVPFRVDAKDAIEYFNNNGLTNCDLELYSGRYGTIEVYHIS